jgi:hypothetical protein
MAAYLEESDIRHDRSDNSDNLGIIVEQISPVLLECDANYTASSASIPQPKVMTYLLQAEKKILMIKLVRLAHFASHPRPAPRRLPVLTAEAIPSEAGTWKNVLVVERRQD